MADENAFLRRDVLRLQRWILLLTISWACTILIWVLVANPWKVIAAQPQSLTLRRLAIVDERGVERVVISAPLPEPIIHGKRGKRDTPMSGILIYDSKGNERGGYGTSSAADMSALLTLDSEKDQVFTAYANADSGATVWVANDKHDNVAMSSHNTAVLEITHGKRIVYKQPPDAPDLTQ